jgi:hypothetical protein
MIEELFQSINNIAETIILMDEGDLEGLTNFSILLKENVDDLKALEGDKTKGLTDALLKLIKATI